jgi:uncharacterized repeat protein (TIGR03803 family)
MENELMAIAERYRISRSLQALTSVLALGLALTAVAAQRTQAQTFTVIHNFTGGADGGNPYAGLTMDTAGNMYGTTYFGGAGYGTVYRLSHGGTGWILTTLYTFQGGSDGASPAARVIIGPDSGLYGATGQGGGTGCYGYGCGTVFSLKPPPHISGRVLGSWTETVLYRFTGGSDGADPEYATPVFDTAGNIYGTAYKGGVSNRGTVYELVPFRGGWTQNVLYSFTGGSDGQNPAAGVIFDGAGNLYGTTNEGPQCGGVFQLVPSGSGWTENSIFSFNRGSTGCHTVAGVVFDQSGNLYTASSYGGSGGGGTVVELTPSQYGSWRPTLLYSFYGGTAGPTAALIVGPTGDLYGTTNGDGTLHEGSVFRLTPHPNGSWTYTDLHDFMGGDGASPNGLVRDRNGNFYGTTENGGQYGRGVVFEITP